MELPYSEFCVAHQLARLLPATEGYSLYVPVSRQQPGVDLYVSSFLYGVGRADGLSYAVVAGAVGIVAIAACIVPARRAARIDPLVALRIQ